MSRPLLPPSRRTARGLIGIGLIVGVVGVVLLTRWTAAEAETSLCRAALPALEPDGRLTVMAIGREGDIVSIAYQVVQAGPVRRAGLLRCAMAESRPVFADPELTAVEFDGRPLGDAPLFLLKRFWLGDPQAMSEGEQRFR